MTADKGSDMESTMDLVERANEMAAEGRFFSASVKLSKAGLSHLAKAMLDLQIANDALGKITKACAIANGKIRPDA